jgi:hypothetical protein
MTFDELKKVGENDKAVFYTNTLCKDFEDGFRVIIGEQKISGKKEYLLLNNDKLVYGNPSIEQVYFQRDILKLIDSKNINS